MARGKSGPRRAGRYFPIHHEWFTSPQFEALSCRAQMLVLRFHALDTRKNGRLGISVDRVAKMLGCSINTARAAFREAETGGWLVPTMEADANNGKARCYKLTTMPSFGREPTDDWRDVPRAVKSAKARNWNRFGRQVGGVLSAEKPSNGCTQPAQALHMTPSTVAPQRCSRRKGSPKEQSNS